MHEYLDLHKQVGCYNSWVPMLLPFFGQFPSIEQQSTDGFVYITGWNKIYIDYMCCNQAGSVGSR